MLTDILGTLRSHESALKARGVAHVAVFGSVAYDRQTEESDIDVLIDLDRDQPISVFDYVAIKELFGDILGERADVVTRQGLKKGVRERIEQEAVRAF